MQMQEFFRVLHQNHLLVFIPLVLIIADMFLYYKGVRFHAGIGLPVWRKKSRHPGNSSMSELRIKLESEFPRYMFRSNEKSLWFRDGSKGYWTGWNIILGFIGKALLVRRGDGLSCRIYLNFSGLFLPCLILDFFIFRTLSADEQTTLAVILFGYAALLVLMTIIRINNFEKVFETLDPAGPAPTFLKR